MAKGIPNSLRAYVFCPFFREDGERKVECEGYYIGTRITLWFPTADIRKRFQLYRCCSRHKHRHCNYALLNYRKYERQQPEPQSEKEKARTK